MGVVRNEKFMSPEWTSAVNEHMSRNPGKEAEDILNSFKAKFRSETNPDPEA